MFRVKFFPLYLLEMLKFILAFLNGPYFFGFVLIAYDRCITIPNQLQSFLLKIADILRFLQVISERNFTYKKNKAEYKSSRLLNLAHMSRNQSGAEKDNRLLFREQQTLLFSKSKMAEVIFSQSEGELRIRDGAIGSDTLSSSETCFHRSLFWARKLPTGLEGLGSVLSCFFPTDSRINVHTC